MVREFAREDDTSVLLVLDVHSEAASTPATSLEKQRFEKTVELCAAIAWNFHERGALLEFRSGAFAVPLAPATENIFAVLRHLALVEALPVDIAQKQLTALAAASGIIQDHRDVSAARIDSRGSMEFVLRNLCGGVCSIACWVFSHSMDSVFLFSGYDVR